jgi:hypothetical protein
MGKHGLSCSQGQWGVLGLCSLCREKTLGTSRLTRPGHWGSLECVVAGTWHCVVCWGYLSGSKASRLELSGAYQAAVALGSTCIGVWPSRSHGSCCWFRRTESVGSRSFGTQSSARDLEAQSSGTYPGLGEQNLCAGRVLGTSSVLWHCCWGSQAC